MAGSPGLLLAVAWIALSTTPSACRDAGQADARHADRRALLSRATFWQPPAAPIERAVLGIPPEEAPALVTCRFTPDVPGGTTAKFKCALPGGDVVRVKYGPSAELHAEVAATRLLKAFGFAADDVAFVRRLRCYGCPPATFATMKVAGAVGAEKLVEKSVDFSEYEEFDWVTVERRHPGASLEVGGSEGWTWFELPERFDRRATRTHVDALRLLAVFLAHWDNKAENQRLACLDASTSAGRCARVVAMIQDAGATFGPHKVDLEDWVGAPIWTDRPSCTIGMPGLPHGGATFAEVRISEEGRRFLGERLSRLTDAQVSDLFRGARFDEYRPLLGRRHSIADWTKAFRDRVSAITGGPPCPPLA